MNPIETLIQGIQTLLTQVPALLQPVVIALAGTIPFVEGELSSVIGVWGGLHPIVAGIAGATGNFACVLVVVLLGARIRTAVIARRARKAGTTPEALEAARAEAKPESKGKQRFRRFLVRFGVPGASLLGPLALPTHFTAATLVASGVSKGWVLVWQAAAIVLWTTITVTIAWGSLAILVP